MSCRGERPLPGGSLGRRGLTTGLVVAALAGTTVTAAAQVPTRTPPASAESVTVVPGAIYRTGSFGRFIYGDHYRDQWTTPIKVPVLSLDQYAGGLRPVERGGSQQTKSLRLSGADGREYVFRSIDKDPSPSLPPELRGTYAKHVVQDLISAQLPGGSLVVARLLNAAGVLHVTPELTVMPDDPRLGAFRQEFAGMLGLIELRPTGDPNEATNEGTGMVKVSGSEKLFERLTEHADETVDARAFLAARLFDMFVGDWDRHPDQWRWARTGNTPADQWQPIPRDRDWALVKLDGLVWTLARFVYPYPQFVSFDRDYADLIWLTWNGRVLDRRLLSELPRPVWDSVATALQASLSDAVIDEAIRRLPPGLATTSGDFLRRTLASRRAHLREAADRFYHILADEAEIHATDENELLEITRVGPRTMDVRIRQRSKSGVPEPRDWYHRRFDAGETREIRIFLHGGPDQVVVRGEGNARTLVRVISGGGHDAIADSTPGGHAPNVRYYDTDTTTVVAPGTHARIDRRAYVPPRTRRGWIDPPRDWGSRRRFLPWLSYTPDAGLFVGGGPLFETYGFRQHPHALQTSLIAGYAIGVNRWRAEFTADARRENSDVHLTITARASELDILHFYGFGNETPLVGSKKFHSVEQRTIGLEPMAHFPITHRLMLDLGLNVRRTTTELDTNRFLTSVRPLGVRTFAQAGARAGLTFDSRDIPGNAKRGVFASLQGTEYPDVWSAEGAFGSLSGQLATYLERTGSIRAGARASRGRAESVGQLSVLRRGGGRRWVDAARLAAGTLRRRRVALWKRRVSVLPHEVLPAAARRFRCVRPRGCGSRLPVGRDERHLALRLRRRTVGLVSRSRKHNEHLDRARPRRERILFQERDGVLALLCHPERSEGSRCSGTMRRAIAWKRGWSRRMSSAGSRPMSAIQPTRSS